MNRHTVVTGVVCVVFAVMAALALWRGDEFQAGLFGIGTLAFLVRLVGMRRSISRK